MDDVLKGGYYESLLSSDNVNWFVEEVIKFENKMAVHFKNTKKDFITTEKDEEHYRKTNICRFCEKNTESEKVRDHCLMTGKYRGAAHSICWINITEKQSNFLPFVFHNFSNYDCHLFYKRLSD